MGINIAGIRLLEVSTKNLYSQLSKVRKNSLSFEDMEKLNNLDPTARLKKKDIAGAYLHWIISDYFSRYPNKTVDQYMQENKDEIYLILLKFHSYRNKRVVTYPDLAKYTYESLVSELSNLEEEYGVDVYNSPLEGRDYVTLSYNNKYIIYEAFNAEGMVFLGKYTNWCIAKRKTFFPDTAFRKQEGGKTFVIESLLETNSNPDYPREKEYYCITSLPNKEIEEMVDADNNSLFYTDKEVTGYLVKDYL